MRRRFIPGILSFCLWIGGCTQPLPPVLEQSLPAPTFTPVVKGTPTSESLLLPTVLPTSTSESPILPNEPCQQASSKVESFEIKNPDYKEPFKVRIYLPPCYDPNPEISYPLLILLHGKFYNDDQWERLGVVKAADDLIAAGKISPLIIAMPNEDDTLMDVAVSPFEKMIMDVLLPWLRDHYSLIPSRTCRAIGGASRGAYWAYKVGMDHWEIFGAIGGHSLPNKQSTEFYLRDWAKSVSRDKLPRFYLDSGTYDIALADAIYFESLLTTYQVPHTWHLFEGGHNEDYWTAHVRDYLTWYAEPWLVDCAG